MSEQKELSKFALKALKRFESKKERKTVKLYVPSLEEDITIQSLTETEFYEAMNVKDDVNKPDLADLHIMYKSVVEPNLKTVAVELKEQGQINEYIDVCNIFDVHEKKSITEEILKLSGVYAENKVRLATIDSLKN